MSPLTALKEIAIAVALLLLVVLAIPFALIALVGQAVATLGILALALCFEGMDRLTKPKGLS